MVEEWSGDQGLTDGDESVEVGERDFFQRRLVEMGW
jgi:hypothetical protein